MAILMLFVLLFSVIAFGVKDPNAPYSVRGREKSHPRPKKKNRLTEWAQKEGYDEDFAKDYIDNLSKSRVAKDWEDLKE